MSVVIVHRIDCDDCLIRIEVPTLDEARTLGWRVRGGKAKYDRCPDCVAKRREARAAQCPSETMYRRHLAAKEKCGPCSALMTVIDRERRRRQGRS